MRTLLGLACAVSLAAGWPSAARSQGGVHRPPLVAEAGSDASGDEGSYVRFSGSATGGVQPYTYEWDFGDGGPGGGGRQTVHRYDDNDEYAVTLTVSDSDGQSACDTATAHIRNVPPTVTITIGTGRVELGEVFVAKPTIFDPSGADTAAGFRCRDDVGDGAGWRAWPRTRGDSYEKTGRHTIQFVARDKDDGEGWTEIVVEADGAAPRWGALPPPRDVVPAGGFEAHAMTWIANTFGAQTVPGRLGEVAFYVANDQAHGVVTRLRGSATDPFASIKDRDGRVDRSIGGNPYVPPHPEPYLMAGPVHRVDDRALLMFTLSGRGSWSGGTGYYGSVDLAYSFDDGQTWEYGGPILQQPVRHGAWATAPRDAYGDYAHQGTSYVVAKDPDGDGVDYFYCYFSQVEGEVLGFHGDFHRNFVPCGVARARVDEVVRALRRRCVTQVDDQGRLVFDLDGDPVDLWWKWNGGSALEGWSSPGRGGRATSVTRVGGAWANQVAWNTVLRKYVMAAVPADGRSDRIYFLTSTDGLDWSEPEPMLAVDDASCIVGSPTIVAPERTTGGSLEVWWLERSRRAPYVYGERGQRFPIR